MMELQPGRYTFEFKVTPELKEQLEKPTKSKWKLSAIVDQNNSVKMAEYIDTMPKDMIKKLLDNEFYPYSATVSNYEDFGETKRYFYLVDNEGKYWGTKNATPEKIAYMKQLIERL